VQFTLGEDFYRPNNTATHKDWFLDPVNLPNPSFDVLANLDFHAWATRPAAVAWVWRDCLMVYSTWRVMMFQEPIMLALIEVQRSLLMPVFRELRDREYRQLDKLKSIDVPLRGIIGALDHHTWPAPPHGNPAQPGALTVPRPQVAWNVHILSAISGIPFHTPPSGQSPPPPPPSGQSPPWSDEQLWVVLERAHREITSFLGCESPGFTRPAEHPGRDERCPQTSQHNLSDFVSRQLQIYQATGAPAGRIDNAVRAIIQQEGITYGVYRKALAGQPI
jgi:hypothetical protein